MNADGGNAFQLGTESKLTGLHVGVEYRRSTAKQPRSLGEIATAMRDIDVATGFLQGHCMDLEAPLRLTNYWVKPLQRQQGKHDGVAILLSLRQFRPEDVVATHIWISGSLLGPRVRQNDAHGCEECEPLFDERIRPTSKSRSHNGGTRDRTRQVVEDCRETMTQIPRRCVLVSGLEATARWAKHHLGLVLTRGMMRAVAC